MGASRQAVSRRHGLRSGGGEHPGGKGRGNLMRALKHFSTTEHLMAGIQSVGEIFMESFILGDMEERSQQQTRVYHACFWSPEWQVAEPQGTRPGQKQCLFSSLFLLTSPRLSGMDGKRCWLGGRYAPKKTLLGLVQGLAKDSFSVGSLVS